MLSQLILWLLCRECLRIWRNFLSWSYLRLSILVLLIKFCCLCYVCLGIDIIYITIKFDNQWNSLIVVSDRSLRDHQFCADRCAVAMQWFYSTQIITCTTYLVCFSVQLIALHLFNDFLSIIYYLYMFSVHFACYLYNLFIMFLNDVSYVYIYITKMI